MKNKTTSNNSSVPNITFLGRLQKKWAKEVGISERKGLAGNALKLKLLETHRENPSLGGFLIRLMSLRTTWLTRIDELAFGFDLIELLNSMEEKPWHEARFLELQNGIKQNLEPSGVMIYQEPLLESGNVYVVTLFDENSFPLVTRMEIRACVRDKEPLCYLLTSDGYQCYSLNDILENWDDINECIKIAIISLYFLNGKGMQFKMTPEEGARSQKKTRQMFPPPVDQKCDQLLSQVLRDKLCCTRLEVPLDKIAPADYEFCMLFPPSLVFPFLQEIRYGEKSELLVYWHQNAFVVSDDYAAYLAYRTLRVSAVPVVVMGDYPINTFGMGERGAHELLPNVTYRRSTLPLDQSSRDVVLDSRLQRDLGPSSRDKFYEFIFQFHRKLNDPLTKERELHNLIIQGARDFTFGPVRIFSEVCLGSKYRADLVVQFETDNRRLLLVELERASLPLFTKSGAQFAHVTHALQQVEDWLRFWQEYPQNIPKIIDSTILPAGVVVIGRSRFLSEDDKRRLLNLNANRRIQLITYDDFIGRIELYVATMS